MPVEMFIQVINQVQAELQSGATAHGDWREFAQQMQTLRDQGAQTMATAVRHAGKG